WRSRAPRILTAMQVRPASRTAPSRLQRAMVPALWYLARARGPLEWLLLISLVDRLVPTAGGLPELQLVGFIVLWALLGTLAIRILDAVVARQAAREAVGDDTAWLRYRSLRAIASTIVCVGLVLSLTRASVGQAAIYAWVWRTCWLLAVPIVLVLLRWWRAPIFARLGARQDPRPIPRWVSAHERGLASFPATVIGAAWLLGGGVWRWLVSQASTLKATRRLLAYLFRRQVERHAAARDGDVTFSPLAPLPHAALDPELPSPIVASVMAERIDAMRALASEGRHRVIAVIGERGLGKTTFLRQVAAGLPAQDTCWIDGTPGGFDELVHGAALVLGATASDESALRAELTVRRPALIVLDDAHLLVRPMIGGLDDLDRVMQLAAQVGGRTTWILAISKYAWHFLRLARSDRAMFDRVVELERWSEEQLNELTRTRATAAHIAPRFDELVIPRQLDASPYETDERAERDYHRILWDYADGNPRMALHWWRESLFERDGNVFVRLFKAPPLDAGEPVPAGLRFVLRAIVQLDLAHERDLIACTNLGATDVNDALRAGLARGLIEPVGERHRIARGAFRAVILFLRRQHLLLP
ncbi:MAG: ATP-binding protein, partial [Kofleriaceae bacterium]